MSGLPLTVVMAVRNGSPYVGEAIESVLAQSVADFEFLIVDDASTDDTPAVLSAYQRRDSRVRPLTNSLNLGPTASVNRALGQARGSVVARHDADDVSPSDRFAVQLEAFQSGDDVSLVTGVVETFGEPDVQNRATIHPPPWQPRLEWDLLFGNAIGAGAHVMFPRVFRGTPVLYPARYRYAQDYGLWCRLCRLGRVVCPARVVYRHRQHESAISSRWRVAQDECASQIRREYQARFLGSEPSPDATAMVSRFWTGTDGDRPLRDRAATIMSMLAELRAHFLDDIEVRYGLAERSRLEAELDEALRDRLGYWLFRSMRFLDVHACRDLLAAARFRRDLLRVSASALGAATSALLRKRAPASVRSAATRGASSTDGPHSVHTVNVA